VFRGWGYTSDHGCYYGSLFEQDAGFDQSSWDSSQMFAQSLLAGDAILQRLARKSVPCTYCGSC
jgi:hypothetical protein